MIYNLFLDDYRKPEDCFDCTYNQVYLLGWTVVKNYDEFVKTVTEKGIPRMLSLDHDLCDEDIEIWKDVVEYEGIYKVSSHGRIMRIKKSKGTKRPLIKPIKNLSGLYVTLRNCGDDSLKKIHRIVLESFIGIKLDKPQVNHLDGNRWNNNINNLEWCTQSENIKHSHHELVRDYSAYGENHGNSKSISQYDKSDNFINTYGSVNEAGRQLKIFFGNIAKCARGERKYAGGFIWKYENKEITAKSEVSHILKTDDDYSKRFFIPEFKEKTGYDCAKWLINYCMDNQLELPETILIHSMNPVGSLNIKSLFDSYYKSLKL